MLLDPCCLTRRSLYRALALASARLTGDAAAAGPEPRVQSAATAAVVQGARPADPQILVVEDNETNRRVIEQQLQVLGVDAAYAEDGEQALERWRSGNFALVFTDLHMPRMDGYALAAAIRAEERGRDARPTAIVALTANALRGEALRCRAAGMNDYLTKPVRLARLQAALEAWLPAAGDATPGEASTGGAADAAPAQTPAAAPAVDLAVLRALIGDDDAAIADVLDSFRITAAEVCKALAQARENAELRGVADAAHKLKSSANAIGALALGRLCASVEASAAGDGTSGLEALLTRLHGELDRVGAFLDQRSAGLPTEA